MFTVSRLNLYLDDDAPQFDTLEEAEIYALERSWDDSPWGVYELKGDYADCISIAYQRTLYSA